LPKIFAKTTVRCAIPLQIALLLFLAAFQTSSRAVRSSTFKEKTFWAYIFGMQKSSQKKRLGLILFNYRFFSSRKLRLIVWNLIFLNPLHFRFGYTYSQCVAYYISRCVIRRTREKKLNINHLSGIKTVLNLQKKVKNWVISCWHLCVFLEPDLF
jgi:hypothetical protein